MPGKATAFESGKALEQAVADLGSSLGLDVRTQVKVGRRLWGAVRNIDIVMTRTDGDRTLGLECKAQRTGGSAEEKIIATIHDITAWPIAGLVVFGGEGFSDKFVSYLHSTGKAVGFEDLESWLRLFFGLPGA
jgi:hypothetical protein